MGITGHIFPVTVQVSVRKGDVGDYGRDKEI